MSFYPSNSTFQNIILDSDILLTWPLFPAPDTVTVTDIIEVTADISGRSFLLPDATLSVEGQNFLFNNIGTPTFDVYAFDGVQLITQIEAGEVIVLLLYDNSTQNGLWRVLPFGSGTNAIVSLTAESADGSVIISNGTITPPGGTIDFVISESLSNLETIVTPGIPIVKTTSPDLTWDTTSLVAGTNILISDPDGVAGNPVINLNPSVTSLTSIRSGEIEITGNTISSEIADGDIIMSSDGTGFITLNGITIDTSGNVIINGDLAVNGTYNDPFIINAWCIFTETDPGDVIVVESQANVSSVTGSNGAYTINFTTPLLDINYGVQISMGSTGAPPPVLHAFWTTRLLGSVTIAIVDAGGEFVFSVPDGVTITVISSS